MVPFGHPSQTRAPRIYSIEGCCSAYPLTYRRPPEYASQHPNATLASHRLGGGGGGGGMWVGRPRPPSLILAGGGGGGCGLGDGDVGWFDIR